MTEVTPLDVDWEDLPATRLVSRRSPSLTDLLAVLVDQPKRWAVIERWDDPKKANARRSTWVASAKRATEAGHRWEFASREGAVYARYMGPVK